MKQEQYPWKNLLPLPIYLRVLYKNSCSILSPVDELPARQKRRPVSSIPGTLIASCVSLSSKPTSKL